MGALFFPGRKSSLVRAKSFGLFIALSLLASFALAKEEPPAPTQKLFSVWGSGPNDVYAVGYASGAVGLILHTKDKGKTWLQPKSNTTQELYSVWGSSSKDIFVVGARGVILHSTDGVVWERQKSPTKNALYAVWGSSSKDVYAAGEAGTILHTKDSGKTWEALESKTSQTLYTIWGSGPKNIWFGGASGALLHFNGKLLSQQKEPSQESIRSLSGLGKSLYAVTNGALWRSTDQGATWTSWSSTTKLYGFYGASEKSLYSVGARTLLRSLDAGAAWESVDIALSGNLRSIWGHSKGGLYVVSDIGGIAYSEDNGKTWTVQIKETIRGGH